MPRRMKQHGRPSLYSERIVNDICEKLSEGKSLLTICANEGMPSTTTVYKWLSEKPDFLHKYARAREAQADYLAEEILEIADDSTKDVSVDSNGKVTINYENINRARLRIDSRKWYASKLAPRKYGDRQSVEMSGTNGSQI